MIHHVLCEACGQFTGLSPYYSSSTWVCGYCEQEQDYCEVFVSEGSERTGERLKRIRLTPT